MNGPHAMTFDDLVADYLDRPDPATLEALRDGVLTASTYSADLDPIRIATPLLERGAHAELVEELRGRMPGAFFSPSTHAFLAAAHRQLGDTAAADQQTGLAQSALTSILGTGDGSAERPWSVLRVSDEYDVLRSLERSSTEQALLTRDGRDLDRHRCDDGGELWFALPPRA